MKVATGEAGKVRFARRPNQFTYPDIGKEASSQANSETKQSRQSAGRTQGSIWEFAKRKHVPALLAAGGIVWLITSLLRRSIQR